MYYSTVAYHTFVAMDRPMRNLCPGRHIATRIVREFELEREYWWAVKHLLDKLLIFVLFTSAVRIWKRDLSLKIYSETIRIIVFSDNFHVPFSSLHINLSSICLELASRWC